MKNATPQPPACVLLVDDEPNVLATLMPLLERKGYLIVTERDPRRVIDLLGRARGPEIEAAVIDLRMPQMDGQELLAQLRTADAELPVLILTGHGSLENAREARERGAFDFLSKPATPDAIASALARAVAWRRARRGGPRHEPSDGPAEVPALSSEESESDVREFPPFNRPNSTGCSASLWFYPTGPDWFVPT